MNALVITSTLRTDSEAFRQFGGVLAADEIPTTIVKRPVMYVVNTDERGRPGTHWTAFYFPLRGPAEFFDSLGRAPEHYHRRFKNALIRNGPRYVYNNVPVQPYGTDTCGQYCIYYLRMRCRGWMMKGIAHALLTMIL